MAFLWSLLFCIQWPREGKALLSRTLDKGALAPRRQGSEVDREHQWGRPGAGRELPRV